MSIKVVCFVKISVLNLLVHKYTYVYIFSNDMYSSTVRLLLFMVVPNILKHFENHLQ